MPYSSVKGAKDAGFPTSIDEIALTLAQINHLAEIYDSIKEAGSAENPMAVAYTSWKGQYKKEGGKWVKKETKKASEGRKFIYLSRIPALQFAEGEEPVRSEIQILRTGKWKHPEYGAFNIDSQDLILFKQNFDNNVRRIELSIDAEHYPEKGAAGWFKELKIVGQNALNAVIEWTKWGVEAIKGGVFKYISPEFDFDYVDNETGKKFKNVLWGGGMTNRPFIKGQAPIALSEGITAEELNPIAQEIREGGVKEMDLKKLIEVLKLKEDASEADVLAKITELANIKPVELKDVRATLELKEDVGVEQIVDAVKKIKEGRDGSGKVTLSEQEVKDLKDKAEAGNKASESLKLRDAEALVSKAIKEGKIVKAQEDWAKKYALADPEGFKNFIKDAKPVVKLDELGGQGEGGVDLTEKDPERKKLDERAKQLLSEKKAKDYKEAVKMARDEQKQQTQ